MEPSEHDIDIAARTLYGEARGESNEGLRAVAHVIINRATIDLGNDNKPDWWGETIAGVCQKTWQFSCWNANDPNRQKLIDLPTDDSQYIRCRREFVAALDEPDPTENSTHYHTAAVSPKWAQGKTPTVQIGRHFFYNDVER